MSSLPPSLAGTAVAAVQDNGAATSGAGTQPSAAAASPTFSPLYQQIKALITQSLQSGEWKPGDMIPSEMDLAARYKGQLHDRASYRYFWSLLQRAHATGADLPGTVLERFFA